MTGPGDWVAYFTPELLQELYAAPFGVTFVMHNASFDLKFLCWGGVDIRPTHEYVDTLILAHLLCENTDHSLGALVHSKFGDPYKTAFWEKVKTQYGNKIERVPEQDLIEYNCKDVYYTKRLLHDLRRDLQCDGIPESLIEHVHSLQKSLLETEIKGIKVDQEYLMQKGIELKTKIDALVPQMRSLVETEIELIRTDEWIKAIDKLKTDAGKARVKKPEFSFDSAKQVMNLLYNRLELPEQKNPKTKKPSVDYDSLTAIKHLHNIVGMLLDYRELQKVYGTYVEGVLDRMVDGRIYPSLNVTGTTTGRISHSNPNLGNMPRSGGLRGMFIPEPGYVFVTADYSSLEVYVEAHFTQDKNLLRLVNEGISKHDLTAQETGLDRNTAKTVNFLAQYHGTAYKLSSVLGISVPEAQKILDKYWVAYGGCMELKKQTDAMIDNGEPIVNPFGRKRRFGVKARRAWDGDYRAAYNARIQGTGSECTSWSFYTADNEFKHLGWGRGIMTLHDEEIMMVKKEFAEKAKIRLVEIMEKAGEVAGLTVKLKAEPCIMEDRWQD